MIDGDTILVRGAGGRIEDVRLLGIDTPETVDPRKPVQCYGPQASAFAKHLETGRAVTLSYDRELHDRYGRFLAYVWLAGAAAAVRERRAGAARIRAHLPVSAQHGPRRALRRARAVGRRRREGALARLPVVVD